MSGQGFGCGIGALFPFLVGVFAQRMALSQAITVFAVLAYGLLFAAALVIRETRGRVLD